MYNVRRCGFYICTKSSGIFVLFQLREGSNVIHVLIFKGGGVQFRTGRLSTRERGSLASPWQKRSDTREVSATSSRDAIKKIADIGLQIGSFKRRLDGNLWMGMRSGCR